MQTISPGKQTHSSRSCLESLLRVSTWPTVVDPRQRVCATRFAFGVTRPPPRDPTSGHAFDGGARGSCHPPTSLGASQGVLASARIRQPHGVWSVPSPAPFLPQSLCFLIPLFHSTNSTFLLTHERLPSTFGGFFHPEKRNVSGFPERLMIRRGLNKQIYRKTR